MRHAFLWESGELIDLNDLVPPTGMVLYEADNINERGEIVAWALAANCDDRDLCGQLVTLVPCDAKDTFGCENAQLGTAAQTQNNPVLNVKTSRTSSQRLASNGVTYWRAQLARRFHVSGSGSPSD
jgi:hypothetical protein